MVALLVCVNKYLYTICRKIKQSRYFNTKLLQKHVICIFKQNFVSTLLKIKNESNSISVSFNSFPFKNQASSFSSDFFRLRDYKKKKKLSLSCLSKLKHHKNQK